MRNIQNIRVLQAAKWYSPAVGGIETVVRNIALGLGDSMAIRVLACSPDRDTRQEVVDNVPVTRAGTLTVKFSTPLSLSYLRIFRKMARNADIIQLHAPFPLADLALLLACGAVRKSGAGVAVWWHTDVVRQKKLMLLYKPLMDYMLRRTDRVFVSSQSIADNSRYLATYRSKLRVIPFGLNIREYEAANRLPVLTEALSDAANKKVLFVGRLVYYKGLDILLEAFENCPGAELFVVGDGPLHSELQERIRRQGTEKRIHFMGKVTDDVLHAAYADCDLLVLPSNYSSECFGLVQLEAMVYGKPVINTNLPTGVPEVSLHGESGITVPPGDPAALGRAIRELCGDDALRERLGRGAYQRVRNHFSLEAMADSLQREYKELLEERDEK